MHRIPLQLSTPSIFWDRELPEYILFDWTLNKRNVDETDKFLMILYHETDAYFKFNFNQAADQFRNVTELIHSKERQNIFKGMQLLNGIVLRAPKDSPVLPIALKLRGNCLFQQCCFEAASMDFEMFLYVGSQTNDVEEMCEINGNLTICHYLMRQYEKSKEYLKNFNKYKALISKECFEKPNLERTNRHISNFAQELDTIEDMVPKIREDIYFCVPFKGFNTSEDIPLSSVTCTYISKKSESSEIHGVFANCSIPKGSIVLVEHPILQSIDTPFVQCEQCLQRKEHIYTCLTCRYKTYCSLKCMRKDEETHRNECVGYKFLILLILDASNLYRIFLRISAVLHERVFSLKQFRKLTTAAFVLEKLQTIINEQNINGMQYLKLLTTKPDYKALSDMQYSTLLTTAFRLTIFIEKQTSVLDSYYKKLRLSNKQKMIVIGSILMRLNCHLLINTFDFEFNYPLRTKNLEYQTVAQQVEEMSLYIRPVRGGVIENLHNHYKVNMESDILKKTNALLRNQHADKATTKTATSFLPTAEQTQPCNPIHRQLSTYKDNIAELYFNPDSEDFFVYGDAAGMPMTKTSANLICTHISQMTDIERYKFVRTFVRHFHLHFADYFLQMNLRHNRIQQIIALLCTTLSKFRHSCDPNVEVVVMENGLVIGKALREIQKDEELLVSYKAHYMRHTKQERKQFLHKLKIECLCKYCEIDEVEEPCNLRMGIYCDSCKGTIITPSHGKCPKCRTSYNALLMRYRTETKIINEEIHQQLKSKVNDREMFMLHLMSYSHACRSFVPDHEFCIRQKMEYAKFLALKNFAKQSFHIIKEIKNNIHRSYKDSFIWFTLYADILDIIKIILYYNVDRTLYSLPNSSLESLCNFGLHIINGQLDHSQLYETFDYECVPILQDLQIFYKWKERIPCIDMLPLSDALGNAKKKTNNSSGKNKAEIETVPTLSKATY